MELKETMSLQEMSEKIGFSKERDGIASPAMVIQEQLNRKYFDPYELDVTQAWQAIPKDTRDQFYNTVRAIPLQQMLAATNPRTARTVQPALREFLASSGTTGIAGAYYLIPIKLWDEMQTESVQTDIVGSISKRLLGPESIPGTTMKVAVAVDGSYKFDDSSSGSIAPTQTMATVEATLDFSNIYTINLRIANDLIEDSQFDLIDLHVREAGRQAGEKASELASTILYTAPDGDGTINNITSGQAYSIWAAGGAVGVEDGMNLNMADGYVPDTLLLTHKAFLYSIKNTGAQYNETQVNDRWVSTGYPTQMGGMNMIYSDNDYLNVAAAKACIFTKEFGILSGRKRWLRIENYSEPVKDLTGAVISFRQDSISLYKDSICAYVETS
jgi:hypothetical protein